MTVSIRLAQRNLTANRGRFVASVGGVALAFSLILALDAIFAGVANQLTRYIEDSGADVWVAQQGVRNLHMVTSSMPASVIGEISAVDGVDEITPLLYTTGTVSANDEDAVVYVIGLPTSAAMGGPPRIAQGSDRMMSGQAIVDARAADQLSVAIGDDVAILGRRFEVSGLSEGTSNLVNSIAFLRFEDFAAIHGSEPVVSYVLIRVSDTSQPADVASAIEREVSGTTALTGTDFAAEERRLVMDMSGDVIAIMTVIGFAVGMAVVAMTVYLATLSRRREFGILKALGASPRLLYSVVIAQAGVTVGLGLVAGLAFTAGLAMVIPPTGVALELALDPGSIVKTVGLGALIALGSALIPVRHVGGLDPLIAFRKGGT